MLRDATGLARNHVRLTDVVQQRRFAVVDVAHDGHDRRTGLELFRRVGRGRERIFRLVLVLAHRLETEFAGDELDLIEVEALIDGDHQSHVLEREADDFRRGQLQNLGELGDRDELVDANDLFLAFRRFGEPCFSTLAHLAAHVTGGPPLRATAHGGERLRDVRIHRFLIDAALPFSTTPWGGTWSRTGTTGTTGTAGTTGSWFPLVPTRRSA